MKITIQNLKPTAKLPDEEVFYVSLGNKISVFPMQLIELSSGISLTVPAGYDLVLSPWYAGLIITTGSVYKSGFTGEIKATILNVGRGTQVLNPGDKLCKYSLVKSVKAEFTKEEITNAK